MKKPVYPIIALIVGAVILLGYFWQFPLLTQVRSLFLEWATILVGIAMLVGIINMFSVHWHKVLDAQPKSIYSGLLLISLVLTIAIVGWFGPSHRYSMWIFNSFQVPVEGSLMALLAVILLLTGIRMVQHRASILTVIFIATAVIILLASGPLFGIDKLGLEELRTWIVQVPAMAGARGILLGVALGILTTGLRILMGAERPYEE
jgi:hypothetical protein